MTLVLDLLAMAIFGLLARAAHQTPDMPFTFAGWVDTTWPFLLGALVGHLVFRLIRMRLPSGLVVWMCAVVVGLGIWAIRHQAMPHWSFILVASTMSAILLFGWRGLGRLADRRRQRA